MCGPYVNRKWPCAEALITIHPRHHHISPCIKVVTIRYLPRRSKKRPVQLDTCFLFSIALAAEVIIAVYYTAVGSAPDPTNVALPILPHCRVLPLDHSAILFGDGALHQLVGDHLVASRAAGDCRLGRDIGQ